MKLGIFIPALTGAVLAGSAAIAQTSQPGTDDRGSIGISGQAAGSGGARMGGSGAAARRRHHGSASGSGNVGPLSGRGSAERRCVRRRVDGLWRCQGRSDAPEAVSAARWRSKPPHLTIGRE